MKVLLIDTNHPLIEERLTSLGYDCIAAYNRSKEDIIASLDGIVGIVIRSRFSIDASFIEAANDLKFIARVGAGLENIDIDTARSKNIHLIAAPEGNRNAVGEHALGMILSLFNHLKRADEEIRNGSWRREENRGVELEGKTIGIIGYGNMGKSFARKLAGFDVKVIFHDLLDGLEDEYASQVSLEQLKAEADIISLHTPQTPLTIGMIDRRFIKECARPFYLINTARGSAVKTKDLMDAIETGNVLGACLDVLEYEKTSFENFFNEETLPDSFQKLIRSDKVLLSPHVAGWTVESKYKLAETIVNKVAAMHS